jgi:hypothetical protein
VSEVRLLVREAKKSWSGTIHGGIADIAIAALSADPVTMTELKAGMARFFPSRTTRRLLANLSPGSADEPHDAGLVVIDLAARLVVIDSTYSSPPPMGTVYLHDVNADDGVCPSYHVSDDWLFIHDKRTWKEVAEERRGEREAYGECDPRAVFYGRPLLEFIAREMCAVFQNRERLAQDVRDQVLEQLKQQPMEERAAERRKLERLSDEELLTTHWPMLKWYDPPLHDIIRKIHAAWLLAPRSDLKGLCPRDWAVRQCSHIGWDIHHRWLQWTVQGECPLGLEESSHAYQFGDFGPHEVILYYELIRGLLWSCWQELSRKVQVSANPDKGEIASVDQVLATEVDRLSKFLEEWLDTPDPEYHLRTPRSIIRHERLRLPETLSPREVMIDPDCPCCQMLAEMSGPTLWGMDGANMDDEFAFDFSCKTLEEWETKQREWEEECRRLEAEQRERERLGVSSSSDSESDGASIWNGSFSVGDNPSLPLGVRTFGMGCRLAEVISDLRQLDGEETTTPEIQQLIDRLNRDFGNLRHVLQNASDTISEALLEPIISHFTDTLADVARDHPEVTLKCDALTSHLDRFLEQPPEGESDFLDVPF